MTSKRHGDHLQRALKQDQWWAHVGLHVRGLDRFVLGTWLLSAWLIALSLPALIAQPLSPLSIATLIAVHLGFAPLWYVILKLAQRSDPGELRRTADRVHALESLEDATLHLDWSDGYRACAVTHKGGRTAISWRQTAEISGTYTPAGGRDQSRRALERLQSRWPDALPWTLEEARIDDRDGSLRWRVALPERWRGRGDAEAAIAMALLPRLDPEIDLVESGTQRRSLPLIHGGAPIDREPIGPPQVFLTVAAASMACALGGMISAYLIATGKNDLLRSSGDSEILLGVLGFGVVTAGLGYSSWKTRLRPLALLKSSKVQPAPPFGTLAIDGVGLTLHEGNKETEIVWSKPFNVHLYRRPSEPDRDVSVCLSVRQGPREIALSARLSETDIPKGIEPLNKEGVVLPPGIFLEVLDTIRRFETAACRGA